MQYNYFPPLSRTLNLHVHFSCFKNETENSLINSDIRLRSSPSGIKVVYMIQCNELLLFFLMGGF